MCDPAPPVEPGPVVNTDMPTRHLGTRTIAVQARQARKTYGHDATAVQALRGVDLVFHSQVFTAIMGPSGSGKSTLMHCMAGLDTLSSGSVEIGGTRLESLDDDGLTRLRRDRVGFVFQGFNLLPTLTARENITLPLAIAGRRADRRLFDQVIDIVGLRDRLDHRPAELSGGQQQRVALARAMVGRPQVVFADEPTGSLDSNSRAEVLGFMQTSVRAMGQTVVMVTHDPFAAACADRVVFMRDGLVAGELFRPTEVQVLDAMKSLGR